MVIEKIVSISQFEQLMKTGLKETFEKSIKDLRGHKVSYEDIMNEAAKEKRTTKIALTYDGTTVISTARLLCPPTGRCEINMVYTNPAYRGQGYAMKSVKKLTKKAKRKVYLIVKKNNTSAKRCYAKAGFVFSREDNGYDRMVYKKKQTRKN
jgi:ribosomal protein S18 acetylase RimI-like enzyme